MIDQLSDPTTLVASLVGIIALVIVGLLHSRSDDQDAVDIIKDLPWTWVKRGLHLFRKAFPREWPEGRPTIVVDITHDELRDRLYQERWETTPYALHYSGEVINMRRANGIEDGQEREIHVRTRDHDGGIEIECHDEASRYTAKTAHLNESVVSLEPGEMVQELPVDEDDVVD